MRFITTLEYFFLEKIIITAVSHGARTVFVLISLKKNLDKRLETNQNK